MIPDDFDSYIYKLLNNDLKNMNDNELIKHYLLFGKNENRIYKLNLPIDFDSYIYKILNNDLYNLSDIELKLHYFNNGKNENRKYNIDINEINKLHQNFINYKNYLIYEDNIINNQEIDYKNELNVLLDKYDCLKVDDRIKISNKNNLFNNYIKDNNYSKHFLNNNFNHNIYYINKNYKNIMLNYNIIVNKETKIKNTILLIINNKDLLNCEIIFNVNYIIISDNIFEYKYNLKINDFQIKYPNENYIFENINYIIYDKDYNFNNDLLNNILYHKNNTDIFEYYNLHNFFENKYFLFQICIPDFNNLSEKLKDNINSWNNEKLWLCKFNDYLSNEFIYNNFSINIYYVYNILYSNSYKTDLLRQCLLFKYGGLYMDISIKLLDYNFLKIIENYNYFTSVNSEYLDDMSNGVLFVKHYNSLFCFIYIYEIVTGVINELINYNNGRSNIFLQIPSNDTFFFGPHTLFNIYKSLFYNDDTFLVGKNIMIQYETNTSNSCKHEFLIKIEINNIYYLQIKYIGYYQDIEKITNKSHYSVNNCKYYSVLNIIDKILIINLKHRIDRKKNILEQINRFNISSDKIYFIDAVYNDNGIIGCALSHIKCIEYAISNNLKNILILEDDYCFCDNIELFNSNLFRFIFFNLDWHGILLSYSLFGPPVYLKTNIDFIFKFYWSHSAASYILNNKIYYDMIKSIKDGLQKYNPIDWSWNYNKNDYNFYAIKDTIGFQYDSYSDIENTNVSYDKVIL
jgi:hypothetical protein